MPAKQPVICVVGLGYVGLPLAAAFGRTGWTTLGFDINTDRISTLKKGEDWTRELTSQQLTNTTIEFSADPGIIGKADTVIIAVPTPVDDANNPDLTPVYAASRTVGKHMSKGTVVIYEATVYPGVTEEECVPILEKESGMKCGPDFTVGYSPERINPGDKEHTVDKIIKVVAGQDAVTTDRVAMIYEKIITAGVHRAANIKVAELAKALENTQRDINIALMNEIARLCDRLGIRTKDVLDAAGTKWNFLKFSPGLVGGHCIGVDPYYLVHKAKLLGMHTEVISAGRKMNDTMTTFIDRQISRAMAKEKISPVGAKVLVLGATFKENVPDTRNAKVHDLIRKLSDAGCLVSVQDPELTRKQVEDLGFTFGRIIDGPYDCIVVAVPHRAYKEELTAEDFIRALKKPGLFYDLKSLWNERVFKSAGVSYLSL
ncbi:MAG: nucleotide sugar dehydrogenase [Candidatus Peribacteraceae bacterium]|nr:nucleotide sugar dehydrogenase [Candidatus Peribacteraceae bacterium]